MYWLDTAIVAALCLGAAMGFWSGLLWQVARVVGLGLALYLSILLNEPASLLLQDRVLLGIDPRVAHGVAYVAVFLAVYVVFFMLTRAAHKTLRLARLELFDRLLGGLLGAFKMALIVAVVCATLAALPLAHEWLAHSTLAPFFARGTAAAIALIPDPLREHLQDNVRQLREAVLRQLTEHDEPPQEAAVPRWSD